MQSKLVLALLISIAIAHAAMPGVRVTVLNSAVSYIADQSVSEIDAQFNGKVLTVPDVSGSQGHYSYTVTNIKLSNLHIGSASGALAANQGVSLTTNDITATVNADWRVKHHGLIYASAHGSVKVSVSSVNAAVVTELHTSGGHLNIKALSSSVSIGNLSMHFSGSNVSWALNLLKGLFKGAIKKAMEKAISSALEDAISKTVENALTSFPTCQDISHTPLAVDYAANWPLNITGAYLGGGVTGYGFDAANHVSPPGGACDLPVYTPMTTEPMMELAVSEWSVWTAGYAAVESKFLTYKLTNKDVPSTAPINLNTTSWKTIVPPLYNKYPDMLMTATIYPPVAPNVTITPSGVNMTAVLYVDLNVLTPNGSEPAFTIGIDVMMDIKPTITGHNVTGNLEGFKPSSYIAKTEIGQFDNSQLNGLILFGASEGAQEMQAILNTGFPLPIFAGYELKNPVITAKDCYLYVATAIVKA